MSSYTSDDKETIANRRIPHGVICSGSQCPVVKHVRKPTKLLNGNDALHYDSAAMCARRSRGPSPDTTGS